MKKISTLTQLGVTYVRRGSYFQGCGSIIYLKTKKQETCQKASPSDALDISHNKCSSPITYRKQPIFFKVEEFRKIFILCWPTSTSMASYGKWIYALLTALVAVKDFWQARVIWQARVMRILVHTGVCSFFFVDKELVIRD